MLNKSLLFFSLLVSALSVGSVVADRRDIIEIRSSDGSTKKWNPFDYRPFSVYPIHEEYINANEQITWRLPRGYAWLMIDAGSFPKVGLDHANFTNVYKEKTLTGIGNGLDEGTKKMDDNTLDRKDSKNKMDFWTYFPYNEDIGYIELFRKSDEKGETLHLFPELFPEGEVVSIKDFDMENEISSMKWNQLGDLVYTTFYTGSNGGGGSPFTITGWDDDDTNHKNMPSGTNDQVSSFKWKRLDPVKVDFEDINVDVSNAIGGETYVTKITGKNQFPTSHQLKLSIHKEDAISLTTTVSRTTRFKNEISASFKKTFSVGDFFAASLEIGFSFAYEITDTYSKKNTKTHTQALDSQMTLTLPGLSKYDVTYTATVGNIATVTKTIKGKFYYDFDIPNSTKELVDGQDLWVREETMELTVEGNMGVSTSYISNVEGMEIPSTCLLWGCYKDDTTSWAEMYTEKSYSIDKCVHKCSKKNFKYAAVANGEGTCYCDDADTKFNLAAQTDDDECNFPCPTGDGFCGGLNRMNVYEIAIPTSSSSSSESSSSSGSSSDSSSSSSSS